MAGRRKINNRKATKCKPSTGGLVEPLSGIIRTTVNRTGQVYLTDVGKSRFMALLYEAETDYNDAKYFDREEDAEICAEDWVMKT